MPGDIMENNKEFLSINEQIKRLKGRNLTILDDVFAYEKLSSLNYYRLSGYSLTLRKNNRFHEGTTFEDIIDIYEGDREIKALIWKYLSPIEIALRTHIAYTVGKIDPLGLSNASFFRNETYFDDFSKKIREGISNNKTEPFVMHHKKKYNGVMPSWVIVELLSFGDLSSLFSGLNKEIKKDIISEYYPGCGFDYLENWLEGLVILRNFCAHHKRLYNRGIPTTPKFTASEFEYFRSRGYDDNEIGKRLFFRILIMCRIMPEIEDQDKFINDFSDILDKHPAIRYSGYSFTPDWKDIIASLNTNFF